MFGKIAATLTHPKSRSLAVTGLGVGALLIGRRKTGASLFVSGLIGMEKQWRIEHAFEGTWADRWEQAIRFYEDTHADDMNRHLHMAGIPLIVLGSIGLLTTRAPSPLWIASNATFLFGWSLNFVGHGFYEKNAPAFQDDPLSFIAGPVWDLQQFQAMRAARNQAPSAAAGSVTTS